MKCPKDGNEMEETWCDDDIHQSGMLYECKCGRTCFGVEGGRIKIIKRGKRKWQTSKNIKNH